MPNLLSHFSYLLGRKVPKLLETPLCDDDAEQILKNVYYVCSHIFHTSNV